MAPWKKNIPEFNGNESWDPFSTKAHWWEALVQEPRRDEKNNRAGKTDETFWKTKKMKNL